MIGENIEILQTSQASRPRKREMTDQERLETLLWWKEASMESWRKRQQGRSLIYSPYPCKRCNEFGDGPKYSHW